MNPTRTAVGVLAMLALAAFAAAPISPVRAAETGAVCGRLTAFTAPAAVSDGSITLNGQTEPIEAGSDIDAVTATLLTALALADADTCLEITADDTGAVTDLAIAAAVELCGSADLNGDGSADVAGMTIPSELVSSDVASVVSAAAAADAELCATLETAADAGSGLVGATVAASVETTFCATVDAVSVNAIVLSGASFPLDDVELDGEVAAGDRVGVRAIASTASGARLTEVSLPGCAGSDDPPGAGPVTDSDGDGIPDVDDDDPGSPGGGATPLLPDTASSTPTTNGAVIALGLGLIGLTGALALRRTRSRRR